MVPTMKLGVPTCCKNCRYRLELFTSMLRILRQTHIDAHRMVSAARVTYAQCRHSRCSTVEGLGISSSGCKRQDLYPLYHGPCIYERTYSLSNLLWSVI